MLGPREVAYVDGSGSGIETVAHLRENGRLVLMFCAFEGAPKIVWLQVQRVADSCGYIVPKMEFREARRDGAAWLAKSSDGALHRYLVGDNQRSVDGLPAMQPEELQRVVIRRDAP